MKTLTGGIDGDERGEDRQTPAGTIGWINDVNHVAEDGTVIWDIYFPNGACWNQSTAELLDPKDYEMNSPDSLLEAALRLQFGYDCEELTMYDMTNSAEIVTTAAAEIIRLVKADEERATPSGWHLFYIVGGDADGEHGFMVSAESASQAKAEELARAAVLDHETLGTDDAPGEIMSCEYIGLTDSEIFHPIGLLAAN